MAPRVALRVCVGDLAVPLQSSAVCVLIIFVVGVDTPAMVGDFQRGLSTPIVGTCARRLASRREDAALRHRLRPRAAPRGRGRPHGDHRPHRAWRAPRAAVGLRLRGPPGPRLRYHGGGAGTHSSARVCPRSCTRGVWERPTSSSLAIISARGLRLVCQQRKGLHLRRASSARASGRGRGRRSRWVSMEGCSTGSL